MKTRNKIIGLSAGFATIGWIVHALVDLLFFRGLFNEMPVGLPVYELSNAIIFLAGFLICGWLLTKQILTPESDWIMQESSNLLCNGKLGRYENVPRESIEKYRAIMDSAADAILLADTQGNILEANKKAGELLGYTKQEIIDLHFSRIHPSEEFERANAAFEQLVHEGSWHLGNGLVTRKDGTLVPVDITGTVIEHDGRKIVQGIYRDISERKRVEKKLKEIEREFRLLVSNIPAVVFKGYVDGTIDIFDEKIEAMIGYIKVDFDSRRLKWTDLILDEDKDGAKKEFLQALKDNRHYVREYRVRSKEGETLWIQERSHIVCRRDGKIDYIHGLLFDVTAQKQAEHRLKEERDFVSALLDTLGALVVVLDSHGRIIRFNHACEEMTGRSFDEVKGRTVWELFLTPNELEEVRDVFGELQSGQFPCKHENHWVAKDKSRRLISWSNTALTGNGDKVEYIIGTGIDITERKFAEQKLRESERYYRSLLFHMHEDILVIDRDKRITDANKDFLETLGRNREEVTGRRCFEVSHGLSEPCSLHGEPCTLEEAFKTDRPCSARHQHMKPDGSKVLVDIVHSPLKDESGNSTHVIQAVRDVTREIELERRLRQAQKMEAIGTLAGGVAHDFNNILGVILGYSELAMLNIPDGSRARSNVEQVVKASHCAKDLVKQILAFSRQSDQERKPVQLSLLVKEDLKLLRATLPATIEIRQNLASNGVVLADPSEIHQILMNLCTNSYHAMKEKAGILEVTLTDLNLHDLLESEPVHPSLKPGAYLKLVVSDTGHGMDRATMDRVFEPYFTTKPPSEGTGLGLAVAHGIVKNYGGAITVYSEIGKGTTFHVYIPRADCPFRKLEESSSQQLPGGEERILFVDDEQALANLGREALKCLGYNVTIQTSSVVALEAFRSKPEQFDLVITDLTMPQMTGLELAGELLRIRSDIPIIFCTGFSESIISERAAILGIHEIIMKPVILRDLAQKVRQLLDCAKKPTGLTWVSTDGPNSLVHQK